MLANNNLYQRLINYAQLMRLHKSIGIFLLLWPTLWALWIAGHGQPDLKIAVIFMAGVIVMRSAGCVINDFADRSFDSHVARTKNRPLAAGKIKPKEAIIVFFLLCFIALILVLQLNMFTIALSVVGLLLAIIYPFTKRFISCPQFVLGAAFAWGVPMAFAAQINHIPSIAWLLFIAALLWPVIYDTQYAMVDHEDDRKIGIKSTALWFGRYDHLIIGIIQTSVLFILLMVGQWENLRWPYYLALLLAGLLFAYQQYLTKNREPDSCFKAFLNNNWVGLLVFCGMTLGF